MRMDITIDKALQMNPELHRTVRIRSAGKRADRYVQTSGGTAKTYFHACGGCCDQPEERG